MLTHHCSPQILCKNIDLSQHLNVRKVVLYGGRDQSRQLKRTRNIGVLYIKKGKVGLAQDHRMLY